MSAKTRPKPRRLFRRPPASQSIPQLLDVVNHRSVEFVIWSRNLPRAAHAELEGLSSEAAGTLLMLLYARERGFGVIRAGRKLIDLTNHDRGDWCLRPEVLPPTLRRLWEGGEP